MDPWKFIDLFTVTNERKAMDGNDMKRREEKTTTTVARIMTSDNNPD